MFNRGAGGPPEAGNQEDGANQGQGGLPPLPALRTFRVTRWVPMPGGVPATFEVLTVLAHAVALGDNDRTVFQVWTIDPRVGHILGPQLLVSRMMTDVIEIEEVFVPIAESSRIIN
jgi:hypothetical protein